MAGVLVGMERVSGHSPGGLLAVEDFSPRVMGVGWSLCSWVFWAMLVQECLEGCFLPLQAGC